MRHRTLLHTSAVAVPVALLAAVLVFAGSAPAATKTLSGSVGPGFTISLKYKGKKVSKLTPGRYRIRVSDKSDFHNFHITRARCEPPHHDGRLPGHEEPHLQAQERDLPLRVRPALR